MCCDVREALGRLRDFHVAIPTSASLMITLSSTTSPRAGFSLLTARATGACWTSPPPDETHGTGHMGFFLASFRGLSGHACVYSHLSALNL